MAYPNIENSEDYAKYEFVVKDFLKQFEDGTPPSDGYWGCPECGSENGWSGTDPCEGCDVTPEDFSEPHFSWRVCGCCERNLGGSRVNMIGWLDGARLSDWNEDSKWTGEICTDCQYYFEYGQLDDQTMLTIKGGK